MNFKRIALLATAAVAFSSVGILNGTVAFAAGPTPVATPIPTPVSTTAPGTTINNQATATYQDTSSTSYTATSNVVTVTMVNVPEEQLSSNNGVSTAGSQYIADGQTVTDMYSVTNTGNGYGNFQFNAATAVAAGGTIVNYLVQCSNDATVQSFGTSAAANTHLSACPSSNPGDNVNLGVQYTVGWAASGTLTNTIAVDLNYPTQGSQTAASISNQQLTYGDIVTADATLNMQKTSSASTIAAGGTISYTVDIANGSRLPGQLLTSVGDGSSVITGAGLSASNPGVLIADQLPTFGGNPLAISGTPTITKNAAITGDTAVLVYTTDTTGKTGWVTVKPASPAFIGLYISGTAPIPGVNGPPPTTPGSVSNGNALFEISYSVVAPSGSGSGGVSEYNQANGVVGSNANCLVGGAFTSASGCTQNIATSDPSATYRIAATNGYAGSSGESNTAKFTVNTSAGLFNGPHGAANATGSYNGVATTNSSNDFTAVSAGTAGTTGGTVASATAAVLNDIQNTGNASDTFTLTAPSVPSGVAVSGYYQSDCTTALGSNQITVASGATGTYCVKYTLTNVTAFIPLNTEVLATSSNTGNPTDSTWNVLLPGGFVKMTKSATVTAANCPSNVTVAGLQVCPGSVVQYSVAYQNVAPALGTGTGDITLNVATGTFVITENGNASGNNWASYSTGLVNASLSDTTAGTTFTGNAANSTNFTATIGGAAGTLAPQASGTLTFSITIK